MDDVDDPFERQLRQAFAVAPGPADEASFTEGVARVLRRRRRWQRLGVAALVLCAGLALALLLSGLRPWLAEVPARLPQGVSGLLSLMDSAPGLMAAVLAISALAAVAGWRRVGG